MDKDRALDFMETVEGWFTREEGALLFDAALASSGAIVEVGSWKGRSTCLLGAAAKVVAGRRVFAVDPHEGEVTGGAGGPSTFEEFQDTLVRARLLLEVFPFRRRSYEVEWSWGPIGLLFIDGLHDEANVRRDFEHFEPHVPAGGFAAFHDCQYAYPGVIAVVEDLLGSGRWEHQARANSLSVLRRVS